MNVQSATEFSPPAVKAIAPPLCGEESDENVHEVKDADDEEGTVCGEVNVHSLYSGSVHPSLDKEECKRDRDGRGFLTH